MVIINSYNVLQTIATVCMFLAGKVEETPRPLKDVILVSYEIINKKDPTAVQRIKQKVCNLICPNVTNPRLRIE